MNAYYLNIIVATSINIILALSLNLVTGYTGQLSLGHAAFMSIGAFTSGILMVNAGMHFLPAILFGALMAGLFGLLIGIPTLRLRGDYLAIATLGFGEIIRVVFLDLEITGGTMGLRGIPRQSQEVILIVMIVGVLLCFLSMRRLTQSRVGRALIAIREDEIAAEAMGVNTTRYKVVAFAVGAVFAGLAGGFYTIFYRYINPASFGFLRSIEILCMVVLGGMGNHVGAVVGASVLTIVPEVLRAASEYRQIFYGILLVVMMIVRPQGLISSDSGRQFFRKNTQVKSAAAEVTALLEDDSS